MKNEGLDIFIAVADESLAQLLNFLLISGGYSVCIANDGKQAMEAIARITPPKLTMLDYKLPDKKGMEVLLEIRKKEDWKSCNVVMLTPQAEQDVVNQFISLGADEYIFTPCQPDELMARMKFLLNCSRVG